MVWFAWLWLRARVRARACTANSRTETNFIARPADRTSGLASAAQPPLRTLNSTQKIRLPFAFFLDSPIALFFLSLPLGRNCGGSSLLHRPHLQATPAGELELSTQRKRCLFSLTIVHWLVLSKQRNGCLFFDLFQPLDRKLVQKNRDFPDEIHHSIELLQVRYGISHSIESYSLNSLNIDQKSQKIGKIQELSKGFLHSHQ